MLNLRLAMILIAVSLSYFTVRPFLEFSEPSTRPLVFAAFGLLGAFLLVVSGVGRLSRRLNRYPPPPFFSVSGKQAGYLELQSDGSYESCQTILQMLASEFGAEFEPHLEAGPRPQDDQDKGYWNIRMFDQDFFLMRDRGHGLCIWGPESPGDLNGFLRVARFFHVPEHLTWQQKLRRTLTGHPYPPSG